MRAYCYCSHEIYVRNIQIVRKYKRTSVSSSEWCQQQSATLKSTFVMIKISITEIKLLWEAMKMFPSTLICNIFDLSSKHTIGSRARFPAQCFNPCRYGFIRLCVVRQRNIQQYVWWLNSMNWVRMHNKRTVNNIDIVELSVVCSALLVITHYSWHVVSFINIDKGDKPGLVRLSIINIFISANNVINAKRRLHAINIKFHWHLTHVSCLLLFFCVAQNTIHVVDLQFACSKIDWKP